MPRKMNMYVRGRISDLKINGCVDGCRRLHRTAPTTEREVMQICSLVTVAMKQHQKMEAHFKMSAAFLSAVSKLSFIKNNSKYSSKSCLFFVFYSTEYNIKINLTETSNPTMHYAFFF